MYVCVARPQQLWKQCREATTETVLPAANFTIWRSAMDKVGLRDRDLRLTAGIDAFLHIFVCYDV